MDLEKQVHDLRKRIGALRATLEHTNDNDTIYNSSSNNSSKASVEKQPSAADLYKAKLMSKRDSSSSEE